MVIWLRDLVFPRWISCIHFHALPQYMLLPAGLFTGDAISRDFPFSFLKLLSLHHITAWHGTASASHNTTYDTPKRQQGLANSVSVHILHFPFPFFSQYLFTVLHQHGFGRFGWFGCGGIAGSRVYGTTSLAGGRIISGSQIGLRLVWTGHRREWVVTCLAFDGVELSALWF